MTAAATERPGWAALRRQWRLGLAEYVMTVLVSLPTAAGMGTIFYGYFGNRSIAPEVTATWDLTSLVELAVEQPTALIVVAVMALVTFALWLVLQAFIIGAILGSGRDSKSVPLRSALIHGGEHFWGLLGLGIIGTPFVVMVAWASFFAVGELTSALTQGTTSSATVLAVRAPLTAAALVIVVWASSTVDLMRVKKVDGCGVIRSFAVGLWRGFRRPFALIGRALPWVLTAWGLTAVISVVDAQFAWTTPAAILLGIGLQQLLVLSRVFIRLGGLAAVQGLVPPELVK